MLDMPEGPAVAARLTLHPRADLVDRTGAAIGCEAAIGADMGTMTALKVGQDRTGFDHAGFNQGAEGNARLAALAGHDLQGIGAQGAGQVMKLAVNLVVHDLNAAVSESLALAESAGIPLDRAYDVLEQSVAGAPFVQYKRAAFLDESTPVAMSLDLVAKDLRLITDLARSHDVPVSSTEAVLGQVVAECEDGRGGDDMAGLARFLRGRP